MTNSSSSVNVLTERDQVMPPNSGYHLSLFANYTLDGVKATVAIAIDSQTGSPCGGWDDKTARALSHVAFQPFTWPVLRDTSPSYTDVKVYNGNEILFHWIFRGYRADTDLSVQQQFADEFFIRGVRQGRARLSVVVATFSGWRVSVFSFECRGRTYAIGPNGTVIAGDSARSRFELRVTDGSSDDAVGNDADRVEFRYRDANNRTDLKCARTSVPATWLTVSHISGPTLIQTISRCRDQRARVDRPSSSLNWPRLTKAGGMTRRRSTLRRSVSWSRSWPAWTQATFTSRPRASSLSGSPSSWQHGRSPRCRMMGRPWLQFLVDRRRSPKAHGRQQPTRPMLWPMCRRVLGRWQSAAGHKMSSRPARSPLRSTRSTTIRAMRRTPGATSRTQFGTRQGMTARSPGPQPSSRRSSLRADRARIDLWPPALARQPAWEEQKVRSSSGFGKRLSSSAQHVQFSKQFCATCSWLPAVGTTCSCRPAVLHFTGMSACASPLCASRSAVAHTRSRRSVGGGTLGVFAFGRPLALSS